MTTSTRRIRTKAKVKPTWRRNRILGKNKGNKYQRNMNQNDDKNKINLHEVTKTIYLDTGIKMWEGTKLSLKLIREKTTIRIKRGRTNNLKERKTKTRR